MKQFFLSALFLLSFPLLLQAGSVGDFVAPDGTEAHCPIPKEFHLKNRGGSDGSGLCVFCSIQHQAVWQGVTPLEDFFKWMWNKPGGGYPSKVEKMIELKCKEMGVSVPLYIQVENNDLDILKLACRSGRSPGITYSFSPTGRYGGQRIAHMVSLVHADDKWFGILDNNYPGTIEWMSPQEFLRSYSGGSTGWSVILLDSGPPPPPRNQEKLYQRSSVMRSPPFSSLLVSLPLLLSPPALQAGCQGGSCAPSLGNVSNSVSVAPVVSTTYSWSPVKGSEDQIALYLGSTQLGVWEYSTGTYFELKGNEWKKSVSPVGPPEGASEKKKFKLHEGSQLIENEINCGVDRTQCSKDGNSYRVNGKPCSREQAYALVGNGLIDDSKFYRITVIGSEVERKQVLSDLESNPYLKEWKGKTLVKSYDPTHWAVKDLGFLAPGKRFAFLVQLPNGQVLHRQDDYEGGSDKLIEALRKIDPNYKPEKDKDQRKSSDPVSGLLEKLKELPVWIWGLLAALGYVFWKKSKQDGQ